MPMMLFPKCWRGREDCEPFQAIDAASPDLTEEQIFTLDYEPDSFVCCGCIAEHKRTIPQDAYRVCFKTKVVDEIGDYDEQDLAHLVAVVTMAQAVISTRRVNGGMIDVPTKQNMPASAG